MRIHTELPDGVAEAPGVVVVMHGPGLDRFVEDRVRALARAGYAAAAPDLYHRQPADGAEPTEMAAILARIAKLRDDEILADIDAAVAHLRGLARPRVTGLAVLGFCMGGRITYLAAGARPGTWRDKLRPDGSFVDEPAPGTTIPYGWSRCSRSPTHTSWRSTRWRCAWRRATRS